MSANLLDALGSGGSVRDFFFEFSVINDRFLAILMVDYGGLRTYWAHYGEVSPNLLCALGGVLVQVSLFKNNASISSFLDI